MKVLALLVVALLTACSGASTGPGEGAHRVVTANLARDRGSPLPAGGWGGDHVRMIVTDTGATMEFDCAHATIAGPLLVDANGRFAAEGVYVAEHGGPIREHEPPDAHPARFSGTLDGTSLALVITLADNALPPATYALAMGESGKILKCL